MRSSIAQSGSDRIFNGFVYVLFAIILLITVYPIFFVVIASFSDPARVALGKVTLWPENIQLAAYRRVFNHRYIWLSYRNTVMYTIGSTLLGVVCTMTGAFVFSRRGLRGSRACMFAVLFTMYFSGGLIPTYFNLKSLGMLNTPWAIIVPGMISGYNLIIARTYIQNSIPEALYEAATIDGCSHIRYYLTVVIPLSGPIIGVLALYNAVGQWNSYFSALVFLNDRKLHPLQLILREILVQSQIRAEDMMSVMDAADQTVYANLAEQMKYALVVVASAPMLILYPFLQRFFVKGVMIGALKG